MRKQQTEGRQTPWMLSIAAVLLVGLSGCLGASGLGVTGTDSLSPSDANAGAAEDAVTTADPPPSTTAGTPSGTNDASADAGQEPPGETTATSETTAEPVTTTESTSGSSTDSTSESSSGSSSGASTAGPTTDTTGADSSTTTETTATATSDAPEPEGPQRGEVVSDDSIQVLSHDIKDYPDGQASVGGSLQNPTDRRLDLVAVTVVLYDESGAEIGRQTTTIADLAPGDTATYAASFVDVAYLDVDRYLIEATAAEAQAGTPTDTSTTPTESTMTPTAAPTGTQAGTQTDTTTPSVSTPPPATETPLPPPGLVSDCAQSVVDDMPAKVVDCQMEDYPQPKADVQVVVANAGEESIDRIRVTLLLFDRDGNEVERAVRFVEDLPPGESVGYVYETETDYEELAGRYVVVVQEVG